MTAAKTVTVVTDPGHVFVPAVNGEHLDEITEHGTEIKATLLEAVVASAQENGVRLSLLVEDDGAPAPSQTPVTQVPAEKQEG